MTKWVTLLRHFRARCNWAKQRRDCERGSSKRSELHVGIGRTRSWLSGGGWSGTVCGLPLALSVPLPEIFLMPAASSVTPTAVAILFALVLSDVCGDDRVPSFKVPGHEREMALVTDLFELHANGKSRCALWDGWLPMSSVWPAVGAVGEESAEKMRSHYRASLSDRLIDRSGYVSMNQHRGLAHPAGWPFPTWPQAGGVGWHFTHAGDGYARMLRVPLATLKGFDLQGLANPAIDAKRGLVVEPAADVSTVTTPKFRSDAYVGPYVIVEWSRDLLDGDVWLEWTTEEHPEFDETRRIAISDENARPGGRLVFSAVPVHTHAEWHGKITRLRVGWANGGSPKPVTIRSIHTATDSRHPITNSLFCRGVCDVFQWTGDVAFLKANIGRVRTAIDYAIREFDVEKQGCVLVPWVGHDGRAGFRVDAKGRKQLFHGRGVGNNYWDLLPCGHHDFLATLYLFDALRGVAELEAAIDAHDEWNIDAAAHGRTSADLMSLAEMLRESGRKLFWNDETSRYVLSIDADGVAHDYGYTFANLEAITYGFASDDQAASILSWLDGERTIESDTSQGEDIYHWRFAPRATTRRNIEWYMWVWHGPDSIPWGGQVQDGGAVLGFSYHDLMARLKTRGPDDAWQRLQEILDWFEVVQGEGGYRAYYSKPGRGTLQGAGTAGGLGLDKEFMESVLVPQVMLYGFLGVRPTSDALLVNPNLPSDWPSLTVTRVHYHDHVLDLTATDAEVLVRRRRIGKSTLKVQLPDGDRRTVRFVNE